MTTKPLIAFLEESEREYGSFSVFNQATPEVQGMPFTCARFVVHPGKRTRIDYHAAIECWVILRGIGLLTYADNTFEVRRGDFLRFESFERHQLRNDGSIDLEILSIWWPA